MSKKVKIGVLVSALWVFVWLLLFVGEYPPDNVAFVVFVFYGFGPLLVGWGIWWIKSDKSE